MLAMVGTNAARTLPSRSMSAMSVSPQGLGGSVAGGRVGDGLARLLGRELELEDALHLGRVGLCLAREVLVDLNGGVFARVVELDLRLGLVGEAIEVVLGLLLDGLPPELAH